MSEFDDDDLPDQDGSSVEEFTVGYGKPPKETRWKPGQSGNPSGRRRAVPTLGDDLIREAAALMTINEGGRPRRVRKGAALIKSMFNHAFLGRVGTTKLLLEQLKAAKLTEPTPPLDEGRPELTDAFLDEMIRAATRMKQIRALRRESEERHRREREEGN